MSKPKSNQQNKKLKNYYKHYQIRTQVKNSIKPC